jgi:DNA topoisomerase-1
LVRNVPETDPVKTAARARLFYVSGCEGGFTRRRHGRGFRYFDAEGNPVREPELISRFKKLVIPPAWRNVWISPRPDGHLQATGRDARNRKQYIYHPEWEEARNLLKFERMVSFGLALPRIRDRVEQEIGRSGYSREKALAFVVLLLDRSLVRIGNPVYTRENKSYGITTLLDHHVKISGEVLHLHFRGKRGKKRHVNIRNPRLAKLAKRYQELPGQLLLQYRNDEGEFQSIHSEDVNAYLEEISGRDFTAKDFRTWGGTVTAAAELLKLGRPENKTQARKMVVQAVKKTASRLGNTPSTCRRYYVHPLVIESFENRSLFEIMEKRLKSRESDFLTREETIILALLQSQP